ncbi:MAG: hypothetical protein K0U37_02555 [Gammaproteobacteria bacterium]|nr:hypothetical protein [Gammaproteobacteria bacterium]
MSKSLDIFKLDQALHAFRSEVIQLNRNSQRFSEKELIELQAGIDTKIKQFEAEVDAFAGDCCEIERMHHDSVLKDIRKLRHALLVPSPPPSHVAEKTAQEVISVAFFKKYISQISLAVRYDFIALVQTLFQVIMDLVRMLAARFALSSGSFFKNHKNDIKKDVAQVEVSEGDEDVSQTWTDVPDAEDESASSIKESKIQFVPF